MTEAGPVAGSSRSVQVTAGELAGLLDATLDGPEDLLLDGVEALHVAGASDLTFITSDAYAEQWSESSAGAALVTEGIDVPSHDASTRALLTVADAELSMIDVLEQFAPAVLPPPANLEQDFRFLESAPPLQLHTGLNKPVLMVSETKSA